MKLRAAKTRDKCPDWGSCEYAAMREERTGPDLWRSVGPCGRPQRQHAVETETIDRLRNATLLDLPRDGAQAERVEGNGGRRAQKGQVAEPRRQFEIAHRQIALDVFLCDQPGYGGFLVAELIDQFKIDRLAAGEDPSVRDLLEQGIVHAAPRLHQIAEPGIGVLDQRVERRARFRTGRFKAIGRSL